jgi:hypothetical protein
MGGREKEPEVPEHENWITEVSDTRLDAYEKMLLSRGADYRVDGRMRDKDYFADLVDREKKRRGR